MDKKSLLMLALGVALTTALFASLFVFQIVVPAGQAAQVPKPALQKIKVSGFSPTLDAAFLLFDGGKDRGIFASYGLDPEFVSGNVNELTLKERVESGIKIGYTLSDTIRLARALGTQVKILAGFTGEERQTKVYVRADGSIKTLNDLNGKKIGIAFANQPHWTNRSAYYLINRFGLKAEIVPIGEHDLAKYVATLKTGRIDAFLNGENAPLRLVDSGELAILARMSDIYPKPWSRLIIFATDDLIVQNPDLVGKFVKATLESVRYLKENPSYAVELYMKRTNAPRDLAEKVVAQLDWTPSGRGSGQDLILAVTNIWDFDKEFGGPFSRVSVKIEDIIDLRFLP